MATISIKAYIPIDSDIVDIWQDLCLCRGIGISGEKSKYVLSYKGESRDGLTVIRRLLVEPGVSMSVET